MEMECGKKNGGEVERWMERPPHLFCAKIHAGLFETATEHSHITTIKSL